MRGCLQGDVTARASMCNEEGCGGGGDDNDDGVGGDQ